MSAASCHPHPPHSLEVPSRLPRTANLPRAPWTFAVLASVSTQLYFYNDTRGEAYCGTMLTVLRYVTAHLTLLFSIVGELATNFPAGGPRLSSTPF